MWIYVNLYEFIWMNMNVREFSWLYMKSMNFMNMNFISNYLIYSDALKWESRLVSKRLLLISSPSISLLSPHPQPHILHIYLQPSALTLPIRPLTLPPTSSAAIFFPQLWLNQSAPQPTPPHPSRRPATNSSKSTNLPPHPPPHPLRSYLVPTACSHLSMPFALSPHILHSSDSTNQLSHPPPHLLHSYLQHREHSGNIQGIFKEPSVNLQWTYN
jgi:hypothetical protein